MVLSTRSHNYLALHLWTEAYEERNETKTTIHKQLYVRCARIETQQRKWIYFKHMHDNLSKNNERWIRFYGNWNWHKTSEWINERNIQEKVIIWLCLVFCVFRCWFLSLFFFLQFFFLIFLCCSLSFSYDEGHKMSSLQQNGKFALQKSTNFRNWVILRAFESIWNFEYTSKHHGTIKMAWIVNWIDNCCRVDPKFPDLSIPMLIN